MRTLAPFALKYVDTTELTRDKPAQLDFLVPALVAGVYRLIRRTLFQNTKALSSGELNCKLTVESR
ncbi:MAG TPA: hypothetical protein DD458_14970 [Prolixibacteraceae bacterium]|nr:hypothetical protein [Prolixibacteraceae bacterium]HCR92262.1 hypothetical protein [Prolixibacteraceae bacterium]HCU63819.1 hypothetical protein [Prolixibacteraceae bacterium]